ncbi:MAG TPA: nitrite reductase [Cyclobacteriaceae bacterium]
MQSFRTELENLQNPVVEKDIIDLERRIRLHKEGKIDDEKFRGLRLARGVYGQRQPGVQMVRIKLPFGKLNTNQLRKIADISDEYASSNLHATTRQDIQIHYVSLERTPELWTKLEQENVTLREACGNTVRNVTASPYAGIDPDEPFDVSPYAYEMFGAFLRNPVCQDMGRKFKISFSSSDKDTAYSYIHDIGFIPKIQGKDLQKGFKIMIGGGLGAQPFLAKKLYDFLPADQIIPLTEAILRIFDRYGERKRRVKARFKFLLDDIGLEELRKRIVEVWPSLQYKSYTINENMLGPVNFPAKKRVNEDPQDKQKFLDWMRTNVKEQKQTGYYSVGIKLTNGDLDSDRARRLADIVEEFAGNDIRISANQGYLLRFIRSNVFGALFNALNKINLAEPGFDSLADVTACPGTDSCNLGISNSTAVSRAFEGLITEAYAEFIDNKDLKIKISGCPNSCGQHGLASIGFHGSSIKNKSNKKILPALQIVLGGGTEGDGIGHLAEKVIKIPSKKGPDALRRLLDDFKENSYSGEYFFNYYRRQGKDYFYQILKDLNDLNSLKTSDYIDWGQSANFKVQTEVGECAGVIIDLVSTLLFETEEKLGLSNDAISKGMYADSIYHSYNAMVNGAKALLLKEDIVVNTQHKILSDFENKFGWVSAFQFPNGFRNYVLRINTHDPGETFAREYLNDATGFVKSIKAYIEDEDAIEQNQPI